ncbi:MAG: DUF177 domain-containing protein [Lentisphaeria bacterium]|jgi:uncharacterized protein|nr:DUF177 domain-containing protein [Lentisphaeria bacterium]
MASCPEFRFLVQDLPDEGIAVEGEVPFAALDIAGDELTSYPRPLRFGLRVSPLADGILVRGWLRGEVVMTCDRCLAPVTLEVADEEVCHHLEHVVGKEIDLTEDLREDILLAFPQSCLCQDECLGLCPECGANLNEGPCPCAPPGAEDNPWSALDNLGLTEQ